MKKLIYIIIALAFSSCVSFKSCPTYSLLYKNETTGKYHVQDTDLMLCPKDTFKVIPSGDRIRILTVNIN